MGSKAEAPLPDDVISAEQREAYLSAIRQGILPAIAAREVLGMTGTKAKHLRNRDPSFVAEFDEARAAAAEEYAERLRMTARVRALDDDRRDSRILEVELATHTPGYEHLRRDRMSVEARVENAVVLPNLAGLPLEKLVALREILVEAGGGMIVDGEYVDLDEPSSNGDRPGLPPAA